MSRIKTPHFWGGQKRGNAILLLSALLAAFLVIGIAAVLGPILGGTQELTKNTVDTVVGNGTSLAYNNTVSNAGTMLSTAYSFGQIVVVGVLGGLAAYGLMIFIGPMIGLGYGGRGF